MIRPITQTRIQSFQRCRRYFYLRSVAELVWPAESTQREEVTRGEDFHLLIRQLILGFPKASLLMPEDDGTMERWVDTFLRKNPLGSYDRIFTEKEVTALFDGMLWLGKFDAVTLQRRNITIFDWKTGRRKPDTEKYRNAPQTRLYRMLAKKCGARLFGISGNEIPAEHIRMIYWFPEYPDSPCVFPYSEAAWQEDLTWLKTLAAEMSRTDADDYPRTGNLNHCRSCAYGSYCFPELTASGSEDEMPEDLPEDDIFQIGLLFPEPPPDQDPVSF